MARLEGGNDWRQRIDSVPIAEEIKATRYKDMIDPRAGALKDENRQRFGQGKDRRTEGDGEKKQKSRKGAKYTDE